MACVRASLVSVYGYVCELVRVCMRAYVCSRMCSFVRGVRACVHACVRVRVFVSKLMCIYVCASEVCVYVCVSVCLRQCFTD